jgi:hypothetical protein
MATAEDQIRGHVADVMARLHPITSTTGPFTDPAAVKLEITLAIHVLELADDIFYRAGLLKP